MKKMENEIKHKNDCSPKPHQNLIVIDRTVTE